jgi:flagella basal body P-ring formation protein FlgA
MLRHILLFLLLLMLPVTLIAQTEWEQHEDIINTAQNYIRQLPPIIPGQVRIEIKPAVIDSRIKLKKCDQPLKSRLANMEKRMGRVSIEIRCNDKKQWTYRLPMQISVFAPIVVTTQQISRNTVIAKPDLKMEIRDISKLYQGYFSNVNEVTGRMARQSIRPGTILNPGLTKAPLLVKRGQTVDMLVKTRSYEIHMPGQALSDGSKGQLIKVKNSSSNRILDARVEDYGLVSIAHHK